MAHETNRHTAALRARDTGKAQITGPIVLVQDADKTPGFLFYAPFYRGGLYSSVKERKENFTGMVYAPFVMKDLMHGALRQEKRYVGIKILDQGEVLYSEHYSGSPDYDFFTKRQADSFTKADKEVLKSGKLKVIEEEEINTASGKRILRTKKVPLNLTDKKQYLLGISEDITEVKANEAKIIESSERLKNILEAAPDGIFSINEKGNIISINEKVTQIFGYKEKELIGKNIGVLVPKKHQEKPPENVKSYVVDGKTRIMAEGREVVGIHKDGSEIPLEVGLSKVSLPDWSIQVVAVARDITGRKKSAKEREELIEKLSDSNQELEKFAYVASHDLQEPLLMIRNFSELLQKKLDKKLDKSSQKYIDITISSAERMQNLVQDLLEYSRITQDQDEVERVSSKKLMQYVLENLDERIKETGAEVTLGKLPTITCNPVRMSRVLQNLIINAIKYQKEGKKPKITVSAVNQKTHLSYEEIPLLFHHHTLREYG